MDYYGKRIATCSTDKTIKIFEILTNENPGESSGILDSLSSTQMNKVSQPNKVKLLATLVGHDAPVWQVQWAHPKFGSILASCGYDRNVIIWKEQDPTAAGSVSLAGSKPTGMGSFPNSSHQANSASIGNSSSGATNSWVKIHQHSVHELSVNSIAWASHEFSLCLACGSSDGTVSILTYHGAGYSTDSLATDNSSGWSVTRFAAHPSGVNAVSWAPFSPNQSSSLLSSAPSTQAMAQQTASEPLMMRLASGGCDNVVHIWSVAISSASSGSRAAWQCEATLEGHTDWIRDVAWAPSIGLPSSLVASASQDGSVRIWSRDGPNRKWESYTIELGSDPVWRVSWSLTGNILAVTHGDNKVSLYKQSQDRSSWFNITQLDSA